MEVIDVDSHVTVAKGLDGSPFRVDVLPDGGHAFEFNQRRFKFATLGHGRGAPRDPKTLSTPVRR